MTPECPSITSSVFECLVDARRPIAESAIFGSGRPLLVLPDRPGHTFGLAHRCHRLGSQPLGGAGRHRCCCHCLKGLAVREFENL